MGLAVRALAPEPSGLQPEKLALSQHILGHDFLACMTEWRSAQLQGPGCFRMFHGGTAARLRLSRNSCALSEVHVETRM